MQSNIIDDVRKAMKCLTVKCLCTRLSSHLQSSYDGKKKVASASSSARRQSVWAQDRIGIDVMSDRPSEGLSSPDSVCPVRPQDTHLSKSGGTHMDVVLVQDICQKHLDYASKNEEQRRYWLAEEIKQSAFDRNQPYSSKHPLRCPLCVKCFQFYHGISRSTYYRLANAVLSFSTRY